ncbi:MAG: hypothetical protein J7M26_02460 [Armatimonadetes bacterium]|nr:hypothetical protein [Armatimonadota bacterium]
MDQKALQDLLRYAQETGQTLEQLQQTVARWQASQEEGAKKAAVATDLEVLSSLLAQARKAGEAKDAKAMRSALRRMNRMARGILAELPGQVIAQRAERALWALSKEPAETDAAAAAILYAVDAAVNAREPKLVPDVVGDLEAAKAAMGKDVEAAKTRLLSVEDKCGRDAAALKAYNTVVALEGAFQALQREAWPVVVAELEEVEILLKDLKQLAGVQPAQAEAQQEAGTGQQPAAPEAGGAANQPEGNPPAEAQTPGEPAAAGGGSATPPEPGGAAPAPAAPAAPAAPSGAGAAPKAAAPGAPPAPPTTPAPPAGQENKGGA